MRILGLISLAAVLGAAQDRSSINAPQAKADFTQVNRLIARACQENKNVPQELVWALIWTESRYDQGAIGSRGERGLAQLMPDTASSLGVRNPLEPRQTVAAVTAYISRLLRKYKGNIRLVLAAYNSGEPAVDRCNCVPVASRKYVSLIADDRYLFARRIATYLRPGNEAGNKRPRAAPLQSRPAFSKKAITRAHR